MVEIDLTHFVDEIKRAKIWDLSLACVEIDLSSMVAMWDWNTLKNAIVDGIAYKAWIENPKIDELRSELQRQAQEKAATADLARLQAKRISILGLDKALQCFENFERFGESEEERDALNWAGPNERAWIAAAEVLNLQWDDPPSYIDIPVPSENIFLVARKGWQATLYMFLISAKANKAIFSLKVALWCGSTFPIRTELDSLGQHIEFLAPSQRDSLPSIHKAVIGYLTALTDLGYLKADTPGGVLYYFQKGAHTRIRGKSLFDN